MDLRQIAYVEAVARNANFTRAAAELHVAQPALSVAIRRLEAELGVRLFERTSRRVSLTPAGTAFVDRGSRVSREVDALANEMREYAGGVRGRLRLSAWYHVEPDLVDFMRDFTAANPLVEVSIQELPAAETLAALRAGDIDLAAVVKFPGLTSTISDGPLCERSPRSWSFGSTTRWRAKRASISPTSPAAHSW
jgi:DNA-binding transcriptional LysR family regulator